MSTIPQDPQPTLTLAPREPITALRFVGRALESVALPVERRAFAIGVGRGDLVVPPELAHSGVAPIHATIERAGSGLRFRDLDSVGGTFRAGRGPRVAELHVEAGDVVWLGRVALLAMDRHLDELRASVAIRLGLDAYAAVDTAIVTIAEGGPLLLIGAPGTDAVRLADAIHKAGAQRAGRIVTVGRGPMPALDALDGATVVIDLDTVGRLTAPTVARMFDLSRGVRVVFVTTSDRRARARLDTYRERVRVVTLAPLASRPLDVAPLLAMIWRDELNSAREVAELGPRALRSLAAYGWPRNLDELRDHAPRILAYLDCGGLRPAARALGIAHQSLAGHFARIGFDVLDQAERAADLDGVRRPRSIVERPDPGRDRGPR